VIRARTIIALGCRGGREYIALGCRGGRDTASRLGLIAGSAMEAEAAAVPSPQLLGKFIVDHGKSADGAGSTAARLYISKFSRPSAQVHGRSEHRRGRGGRGTGRPGACTGALDDQTRIPAGLVDGMTAAGLENATIEECSLV